jgi:hypothetical protein
MHSYSSFDRHAYTSRSGFVDWLVGRQEPHWDWTRRWIYDYGAMGLRGLAWTMPVGHIMYHAGFSWQVRRLQKKLHRGTAAIATSHPVSLVRARAPFQFAISGALMPAIYTLGNWPHTVWTVDGWEPTVCNDPPFQVDWVRRGRKMGGRGSAWKSQMNTTDYGWSASPPTFKILMWPGAITTPQAFTNSSEFLFGYWHWITLLAALLRYPQPLVSN